MTDFSDFRMKKTPFNHRAGDMPVLGFGTLIPDAATTVGATRNAVEAGFRHFEERFRRERQVGQASQAAGRTGFRGQSGQTCAQLLGSLSHSLLHRQDAGRGVWLGRYSMARLCLQRLDWGIFNEVVKTGRPVSLQQRSIVVCW